MSALLKTTRECESDYLRGQEVHVTIYARTGLQTYLRMSNNDLICPDLVVESPGRSVRIRTRLFVPGAFFRREEADRILRGTGYMHAHAFALAAICQAAPDLQSRYGLLAFGTVVPGELGPRVLCASMSDFLSKMEPAVCTKPPVLPKRTATALPIYGGCD